MHARSPTRLANITFGFTPNRAPVASPCSRRLLLLPLPLPLLLLPLLLLVSLLLFLLLLHPPRLRRCGTPAYGPRSQPLASSGSCCIVGERLALWLRLNVGLPPASRRKLESACRRVQGLVYVEKRYQPDVRRLPPQEALHQQRRVSPTELPSARTSPSSSGSHCSRRAQNKCESSRCLLMCVTRRRCCCVRCPRSYLFPSKPHGNLYGANATNACCACGGGCTDTKAYCKVHPPL